LEVFDDWFAGGKIADDEWKKYELARKHNYLEALSGLAADHVFSFDKFHLDRSDIGILVCPAGKSCHLELGYLIGQGKPGFVLLDSEDIRWDVMYKFATGVYMDLDSLVEGVEGYV
jgi:nucleoside 2-deoxyribosyltransferase